VNDLPKPLLHLKNVTRYYRNGDAVIKALDGVSLTIWPSEFVAIMGPSGSGKTTLMNIMGCLDRPTSGNHSILSDETAGKDDNSLADLRRNMFGFIFQRYNLLATATAEENVEMPSLYAGLPKHGRIERANKLLAYLGLNSHAAHRPSELSGGQQQRVAIARALMNEPQIILADEPTGALDSHNGNEVMGLIKDLNRDGRSVILVTHDEKIASHAKRIIRMQDGKIVNDSASLLPHLSDTSRTERQTRHSSSTVEISESIKLALRAMRTNLFRTSLTLLGVVIGVAAIITMMAVGEGGKEKVLHQISAMGTNLLIVRPGTATGRSGGNAASLIPSDAEAIGNLFNIEAVSGSRSGYMTLRYGNSDYPTIVQGVSTSYPAIRDWAVATGNFFTDHDIANYTPVVVLGQTAVRRLFHDEYPLGRYIIIHNIPFQVIGIMTTRGASPSGPDQDDIAFVPLSVGLIRLFGNNYVSDITVKVHNVDDIDRTASAIDALLLSRHQARDFQVRNMTAILETAMAAQNTLTLLLGAVAAIALVVGGIGVMNIMLVNVTERTREIGIRMAVGARRRDIMLQFSTEAAVICLIGGILGIAFGLAAGSIMALFGIAIAFSLMPILLSFFCSALIGLIFGYLPARKAALLDPVAALAFE
jgi:macrolide transport system ATP-binding/permease protein